ncbi:serine/threonine protein kinase [Lentisphaera araneosa HTCC2155]|uniref:mitogen-activated protein kinase kinase n=1 Tax=Lentisphaera araneosa HTCC2155 TaxID=313628 RepID=A6DH67_9BACT|nr:serine/threonine-protein kinase [Lentisphaera araneosa]EDM28950.1 serine/threonine protein kinase [Lentisphaera araneosa HTCC2155]
MSQNTTDQSIYFRCNFCYSHLNAEADLAKSKIACPYCHRRVTVPKPSLDRGYLMKDWEVVRLLGQGSMGEVYEVSNSSGKRGAMKVVHQDCMSEEETQYLQDEAQILLKLRHKNIVKVHEAGFDGLQYFFVQELVLGRNTGSTLKKYGAFKQLEAFRICRDVASAMQYLWEEAKIIHRDIKPDNIMLSREGVVKLMDLGVGMTQEQAQTQGYGAGTPYYMSPEMIQKPALCDFRTDIYSLGISLVEMLSGSKPYMAADRNTVFDKILSEDVKLSALPCSDEGKRAIAKLIHRNYKKRPASWAECVAMFDLILEKGVQGNAKKEVQYIYDLGQDKAFMAKYYALLISFFVALLILIYVVI